VPALRVETAAQARPVYRAGSGTGTMAIGPGRAFPCRAWAGPSCLGQMAIYRPRRHVGLGARGQLLRWQGESRQPRQSAWRDSLKILGAARGPFPPPHSPLHSGPRPNPSSSLPMASPARPQPSPSGSTPPLTRFEEESVGNSSGKVTPPI
jgi:hypothetical protein